VRPFPASAHGAQGAFAGGGRTFADHFDMARPSVSEHLKTLGTGLEAMDEEPRAKTTKDHHHGAEDQ